MTLELLFGKLWEQYSSVNVQAEEIQQLLKKEGENVVNDHVAFRTFNHPKINVATLGKHFEALGYEAKGDYEFTDKKLDAVHYEHPSGDWPLVFISELRIEDFSEYLQTTINALIDQVDEADVAKPEFLWSGVNWDMVSYDTYLKLLDESEYAAWTAAFGFRANHFTILVNELQNFDIRQLNEFIKANGYPMNTSGGEVKGSPEKFLEQSSTLASKIDLSFSDKVEKVPCCYYEFAERFPLPNGNLFSGFVASSADKIFESTNVKS